MRILPPLGELTQDKNVPEWWTSRPLPVPYFSGSPISFTVMTDTPEADFPPGASDAIRNFLSLDDRDRRAASQRVYENYRVFADAVEEVGVEIADAANVWDHVEVGMIYVSRRHRRDRDIYVQLACICDWEGEHGLQLVFRGGSKLCRVSEQDGHLTDADAYDLPEDQEAMG